MKKLDLLKDLCRMLIKSQETHLLIAQGPAGIGKSTAIEQVLAELSLEPQEIGSFTTPLGLYNSLAETPDRIFLLDDTYNVFEKRESLAVLKAATHKTAGSGGRRIVRWVSSSKRVLVPAFEFSGKVIMLCNQITDNGDARALMDRAFPYEITLSREERYALVETLKDTVYKNDVNGQHVCNFVLNHFDIIREEVIQYRSIGKWRQFPETFPKDWQEKLLASLPKRVMTPASMKETVLSLSREKLPVKRQCLEFKKITGFSESTFYRLRREVGLGTGIFTFDDDNPSE